MLTKSSYWFVVAGVIGSLVLRATSNNANPQMKRKLLKQGFHRELKTSVNWLVNPQRKTDVQDCYMMLMETLPSGVYVDPFQLSSMLEFNGPKVLISTGVDIEKPEHLSPFLTLYVYSRFLIPKYSNQGFHMASTVSVPVHLRYHKPSQHADVSHIDVVIPNPRFFTNCIFKDSITLLQAPCDYRNSSLCFWHEHIFESEEDMLIASVPVGNLQHATIVVAVTLLVTCLGTLIIVYTVWTKSLDTKLKTS